LTIQYAIIIYIKSYKFGREENGVPTRVISAYVTQRNEFQVTNGYQPTNSLFYLLEGSFSCAWNEKEELVRAGDVVLFDTETPMRRRVLEPVRFVYIKYDKDFNKIRLKPLFRLTCTIA
jgi:hypothetical protein